jgi:hypothetical protein
MWNAVRLSALAREAARLGVAWSLKCAILWGNQRPEEIALTRLCREQASAKETADRIAAKKPLIQNGRALGVMNQKDAEIALAMWRQIGALEAETQQEITGGA